VYGCKTWFIVREQLGVYEGKVLRKCQEGSDWRMEKITYRGA